MKTLVIPQPSMNDKEDFRKAMQTLVLALGEAFNSDGRVQINSTEFTVILTGWERNGAEWPSYKDECSISVAPVVHELSSIWDGNRKRAHILLHQNVTINVDHTETTWQLIPIGGSVFGQNRIEQQAGSPKPEPEVIHPEPDYDEYDYD